MKMSGSSRDYEHECALVKTLRRDFSKDGVFKFADVVGAQANKACDQIENGEIVLTFVISTCICRCSVSTLEHYN